MVPRTSHVLLVRPWGDHHAGSGCCTGDPAGPIGLDHRRAAPVEHSYATRVVAQAYARLRRDLPDVDVQVVSSSNTVYLVPTMLRARRQGEGVLRALQRVNRATRPGSVLVDGHYAGDIVELGPRGVVEAVRAGLS